MSLNMVSMHERIHRRSGHIAVIYKKYLLVWGGYMERHCETCNGDFFTEQEYHYTDELWAYDCYTEIWERIITNGDIPSKTCGSCGIVLGDSLYVFGGYYRNEISEGNSNMLYRLDLKTKTWKMLRPGGMTPIPCDKLTGWAYEDKLYWFGGFGPPPEYPFRPPFLHVMDGFTLRGWNNQLAVYNPVANEWEWPKVAGTAPNPRAAHSADITGDKVYIFGGRFQTRRCNDLHCLDLEKMRWTVDIQMEGPLPQGRSWHSFTFISPDRAVLYGGFNNENVVLNDCWIADVTTLTWHKARRRPRPTPASGRYWHSSRLSPANQEVLCTGGLNDHADEMLVLDFTPKSLFRTAVDAVLTSVPRRHWIGPPNGESCLPLALEALLRRRFEQVNCLPELRCS